MSQKMPIFEASIAESLEIPETTFLFARRDKRSQMRSERICSLARYDGIGTDIPNDKHPRHRQPMDRKNARCDNQTKSTMTDMFFLTANALNEESCPFVGHRETYPTMRNGDQGRLRPRSPRNKPCSRSPSSIVICPSTLFYVC